MYVSVTVRADISKLYFITYIRNSVIIHQLGVILYSMRMAETSLFAVVFSSVPKNLINVFLRGKKNDTVKLKLQLSYGYCIFRRKTEIFLASSRC
jgi:hypothetical protein